MRRFFVGIFALILCASCDDGEIIVTSFDFEDSSLQFCAGTGKNVIYAINNDDVFESISLEYNDAQLRADENGQIIPPEEDQISFNLNESSNRMVYRLYDGEVPSNYFCNVVPPSQPKVVEEWKSASGGTVFINTGFTDETGNADPDRDGLTNSQENWDPDGLNHQDSDTDGIPDYLDRDDDGDNVPTQQERVIEAADDDGIPNYLDEDDDGDGVLTRFEVSPNNPSRPDIFSSTGDGVPNYLNPEQTSSFEHDEYITHTINRSYGLQIFVENLKFEKQDGSGETIQFQNYNLGTLRANSIPFEQCPSQDPDCAEEEETGTEN